MTSALQKLLSLENGPYELPWLFDFGVVEISRFRGVWGLEPCGSVCPRCSEKIFEIRAPFEGAVNPKP